MQKVAPRAFAALNEPHNQGMLSDNSDHQMLDDPEFQTVKKRALDFEKLFEMQVNFEHYVDHCVEFPDRIAHFARGGSPIDASDWFDIPTDEHQKTHGKASM